MQSASAARFHLISDATETAIDRPRPFKRPRGADLAGGRFLSRDDETGGLDEHELQVLCVVGYSARVFRDDAAAAAVDAGAHLVQWGSRKPASSELTKPSSSASRRGGMMVLIDDDEDTGGADNCVAADGASSSAVEGTVGDLRLDPTDARMLMGDAHELLAAAPAATATASRSSSRSCPHMAPGASDSPAPTTPPEDAALPREDAARLQEIRWRDLWLAKTMGQAPLQRTHVYSAVPSTGRWAASAAAAGVPAGDHDSTAPITVIVPIEDGDGEEGEGDDASRQLAPASPTSLSSSSFLLPVTPGCDLATGFLGCDDAGSAVTRILATAAAAALHRQQMRLHQHRALAQQLPPTPPAPLEETVAPPPPFSPPPPPPPPDDDLPPLPAGTGPAGTTMPDMAAADAAAPVATAAADAADAPTSAEVSLPAPPPPPPAEEFRAPVYRVLPVPFHVYTPSSAAQHRVIEATAKKVVAAAGGATGVSALETMLRTRQATSNPLFSFLLPTHALHRYYCHLKDRVSASMRPAAGADEVDWPEAVDPPAAAAPTQQAAAASSAIRQQPAAEGGTESAGAAAPVAAAPASKLRAAASLLGNAYDSDCSSSDDDAEVAGAGPAGPAAVTAVGAATGTGWTAVTNVAAAAPAATAAPAPAPPPPPPHMLAAMTKLASYTQRNGRAFLDLVLAREKDNPKFSFLQEWSPHHRQWCKMLEEVCPPPPPPPPQPQPVGISVQLAAAKAAAAAVAKRAALAAVKPAFNDGDTEDGIGAVGLPASAGVADDISPTPTAVTAKRLVLGQGVTAAAALAAASAAPAAAGVSLTEAGDHSSAVPACVATAAVADADAATDTTKSPAELVAASSYASAVADIGGAEIDVAQAPTDAATAAPAETAPADAVLKVDGARGDNDDEPPPAKRRRVSPAAEGGTDAGAAGGDGRVFIDGWGMDEAGDATASPRVVSAQRLAGPPLPFACTMCSILRHRVVGATVSSSGSAADDAIESAMGLAVYGSVDDAAALDPRAFAGQLVAAHRATARAAVAGHA